jgi:hypothetical protein
MLEGLSLYFWLESLYFGLPWWLACAGGWAGLRWWLAWGDIGEIFRLCLVTLVPVRQDLTGSADAHQ